MASHEQLRAMFNGMDLAQKGQFINNLKKSMEGGGNTENAQFLDECIAQYNEEVEATAIPAETGVESLIESTDEIALQEHEPEPEPEPEYAMKSEYTTEPATESEYVPESDPAPEPEPEYATELEPALTLHDDADSQEPVSERIGAPTTSEKNIDNIANDIYGLAGNIKHNMNVIETISNLLSGTAGEAVEAGAQASEPEPALTLASASAYERKIEHIKERVSEVADSIHRDLSVIESISAILSGGSSLIVEMAVQAKEPDMAISSDSENAFDLQKKNDSVSSPQALDTDAANNQEANIAETLASIFTENEFDDALVEFSGLVESIRHEVSSLIYAMKEFSDVAENIRHVLNSRKTAVYPQSISSGSIADNNTTDSSIAMAVKNDTEPAGNIPNDITPNKTVAKTKRNFQGIKLWILIPAALCIAAAIAALYFMLPITRWFALAIALAWLGLSFYKKPIRIAGYEIINNTKKIMPIIASAIALLFIFVLPIINGIFVR